MYMKSLWWNVAWTYKICEAAANALDVQYILRNVLFMIIVREQFIAQR